MVPDGAGDRARDRVEVTREAALSADRVWRIGGAFDAIADWLPGAVSLPAAPGRRAFRIGEAEFLEELVTLDTPRRRLSYRLISGPLPVMDYEADLTITAEGQSRCIIGMTARYRPLNIGADRCRKILTRAFESSLKALETSAAR